jgi:hypothetical protein
MTRFPLGSPMTSRGGQFKRPTQDQWMFQLYWGGKSVEYISLDYSSMIMSMPSSIQMQKST